MEAGVAGVGEMPCDVKGVEQAPPPDPAGLGAIVRTQAFVLCEIRSF